MYVLQAPQILYGMRCVNKNKYEMCNNVVDGSRVDLDMVDR